MTVQELRAEITRERSLLTNEQWLLECMIETNCSLETTDALEAATTRDALADREVSQLLDTIPYGQNIHAARL
jgi:hypothetical protein